jgi:hypothetical protein
MISEIKETKESARYQHIWSRQEATEMKTRNWRDGKEQSREHPQLTEWNHGEENWKERRLTPLALRRARLSLPASAAAA